MKICKTSKYFGTLSGFFGGKSAYVCTKDKGGGVIEFVGPYLRSCKCYEKKVDRICKNCRHCVETENPWDSDKVSYLCNKDVNYVTSTEYLNCSCEKWEEKK